ncbi:hypothetical protein [Muribaculum intestinale]|uniref:hypothetical protein n=1 Tax=Muribaculum intestinale TaxID=1796646 RepID=UPI003F667DC7
MEENAYYIFDRGYNDFAQLYRIQTIGACFVIRAKNNVKYRVLSWKEECLKGSYRIRLSSLRFIKSSKVYPEKLRRVVFRDEETGVIYTYLTNDLEASGHW